MLEITKLKGVKEPKAGILIYEFGFKKKDLGVWSSGSVSMGFTNSLWFESKLYSLSFWP
jgi:hypothetical protein